MRKTILTLAMTLTMAFAAMAVPTITATPASKPGVELKGDSVTVTSGDKSITIPKMDLEKVNEKINKALDDTLTAGNGTTVEIGNRRGELSPEDIKVISGQWAVTSQVIACVSILGLLLLVLLVLFFRFLNRRSKYRVIERAIENNYPLNDLSLNDFKHRTVYVQQPVVTTPPMAGAPAASSANPGQATMGTPISGQTPNAPIMMTDVFNWRALMPAVKWAGWGFALMLFGFVIGDLDNPFWPVGLALLFVGLCKGFILYKEQKALQEAWRRAEQKRSTEPQQEPMREGIPVPPPFDEDYKEDDNNTYQPY